MLASVSWLRELCPVEGNVRRIADALTARGLTVDSVQSLGEDHVLEIDVPANRPDCLGHLGLARELGAALDVPVRQAAPVEQDGAEAAQRVRVEIEEPALCPRYTARLVRDVRVGPSPDWVSRRLEACGLRSINNVVDISNLVLLELGHPIHFFDLARIEEATIRVRRAAAGEPLTTLDGVPRALDPETLVIADARRAVAIAGVMGGADTEIGAATRDVLIEAACFQPRSIRRTARRIGLLTDASHRFERGVDPQGVVAAQAAAAGLLQRLAGGKPVPGMVDAYPAPAERRRRRLRHEQLLRLLGYEPAREEVLAALRALRLDPGEERERSYEIVVPSWRVDLEGEADLVEEVARHLGYDRIPTGRSGLPQVAPADSRPNLAERTRDVLSQLGFHEAFGYAMIGSGEDDRFAAPDQAPAIALGNPIAESLARLRRSILPGLLRSLDLNQRRGLRDIRLFEVGRVFLSTAESEFPRELQRAGLAWSGAGEPRHWGRAPRTVDLFDLIGIVERLIAVLRPGLPAGRTTGNLPALHPGYAVTWRGASGETLAWGGALHPDLAGDLTFPVFVAEIDLEALSRSPDQPPRYEAIPRLTAVTRDLAVVMTGDVPYGTVVERLRRVEAPAAVAFEVVDRYEGPPLQPGQFSLTVRFTLQPVERSLNEEQIEGYRRNLVRVLAHDLGIPIRD